MLKEFLTALRQTGDIVEALSKSGLAPSDYREWYSRDEQFRKDVDSTLTGREICLENRIREMGQRKLLDLLESGQTVRRIRRRMRYGPDGELLFTDVATETLEMGTPEWAIKVATQRTSIEEALTVLASESLLPTDTVRAIMSRLSNVRNDISGILGERQDYEAQTGNAVLEAQASLLGVPVSQLAEGIADEATL
jgi:hypothetical protein